MRAFSPWPGSYTKWQGKQLKIIEAVPVNVDVKAEPGLVISLTGQETELGIGTGDGVLGIARAQLEGKKAMYAADFLRGHRELIGARLPS